MGTCGTGSTSALLHVGQHHVEVLTRAHRDLGTWCLQRMSSRGGGGAGPEVGPCGGVNWGPLQSYSEALTSVCSCVEMGPSEGS